MPASERHPALVCGSGGEPKVTVLTPTYNRPQFLPGAIRSVLDQRLTDWEMLVINDGGRDVREIVESFDDPRLRYFNRDENRGKAACLNFGLRRARGNYVAYLDDDDLWYPNHLAVLSRALDEDRRIGVAYSDLYKVSVVVDEGGRRYPLQKEVEVCRNFNRLFMFHFNHTLHVSLMHRRGLASRAGGYDERVRVMIDWNLTRKLSFFTDFRHVPLPTGEYYLPISGSDRISDRQRRDEESYRWNLRRIRADLPPEPWPYVEKTAVVFPVDNWEEGSLNTLRRLADGLKYPTRVVLVNRTGEPPPKPHARFVELSNWRMVAAPEANRREAYRLGARAVEADFYYLASSRLAPGEDNRLVRALCWLQKTGCGAVRWPKDPPDARYDIFLSADEFSSAHAPWPEAQVVPEDWLPKHLEADLMLSFAHECAAQGDYAAARALVQRASGLERGGVGAAYAASRYAELCFKQGDYAGAERGCREMIEMGYGADNWVRLGRIHQHRCEFAEAIEAYRTGLSEIGLEEGDADVDVFPIAGTVEYDVFLAVVGLGECLVGLGRLQEAARCLRRASRLQLNSHRPPLAFGRLFLQRGDLNRAEEALGRAAARHPGEAAAAEIECLRARVDRRAGNPESAFQHCRAALTRSPGCAEALALAEKIVEELGTRSQMEPLYRRFLDHRPGHADAMLGLAELLARRGETAEAHRLAERVALLNPGNQRARQLLADRSA